MKREITIPLHDATRILSMNVMREHFPQMCQSAVSAETVIIINEEGLVSEFKFIFETVETAAD